MCVPRVQEEVKDGGRTARCLVRQEVSERGRRGGNTRTREVQAEEAEHRRRAVPVCLCVRVALWLFGEGKCW